MFRGTDHLPFALLSNTLEDRFLKLVSDHNWSASSLGYLKQVDYESTQRYCLRALCFSIYCILVKKVPPLNRLTFLYDTAHRGMRLCDYHNENYASTNRKQLNYWWWPQQIWMGNYLELFNFGKNRITFLSTGFGKPCYAKHRKPYDKNFRHWSIFCFKSVIYTRA